MDYTDNPERELLTTQILCANSLPEVHAAQAALRRWRSRYPDDWGTLDAGEQLSLMEDVLLEDDSLPGTSPSWTEWQRLEYRVMGARTFPEVDAARRDLQDWIEHHPAEVKNEWLETLFLLLEVVEAGHAGDAFSDVRGEREPARLAARG